MYLLVVYDIKEDRVSKVSKFLRQYLYWVQNSVFEGEVTEAKLEKIKLGLKKIIDINYDSILFYSVSDEKWINKQTLGVTRSPTDNII